MSSWLTRGGGFLKVVRGCECGGTQVSDSGLATERERERARTRLRGQAPGSSLAGRTDGSSLGLLLPVLCRRQTRFPGNSYEIRRRV